MTEEQAVEVYKLACSVCKTNNVNYDEDLIQELVLHAVTREEFFDPSLSSRSTFMFMAMKQRLIDIFKYKTKPKRDNGLMTYSLDYRADEDSLSIYEVLPNDEDVIEQMNREDFLKSIDHLIEEPLRLYLNGYTQREIGEMKGCSSQYICSLIKKNIEKIKNYCEENNLHLWN